MKLQTIVTNLRSFSQCRQHFKNNNNIPAIFDKKRKKINDSFFFIYKFKIHSTKF